MFELAKLYRDSGDLANAESRATQGLIASQFVGDRYYVPRDLTVLADLKVCRGHLAEADALYQQAEDVIDGMLGGDDSYWNSSIAAAMSQTYLQHFQVLVKHGNTPGAFHVIERVRGRTLAAALRYGKTAPSSTPAQTTPAETDVAGIQTRLMRSSDPAERQQLLNTLAHSKMAQFSGARSPGSISRCLAKHRLCVGSASPAGVLAPSRVMTIGSLQFVRRSTRGSGTYHSL